MFYASLSHRLEDVVIELVDRSSGDVVAKAVLPLRDFIDGFEHSVVVDLLPIGSLYLYVLFKDSSSMFGLPLAEICRREGLS